MLTGSPGKHFALLCNESLEHSAAITFALVLVFVQVFVSHTLSILLHSVKRAVTAIAARLVNRFLLLRKQELFLIHFRLDYFECLVVIMGDDQDYGDVEESIHEVFSHVALECLYLVHKRCVAEEKYCLYAGYHCYC